MSILDNLLLIKNDLPEGVELVAVSKTHPNDYILEAYNAGQRVFGENKVQDLVRKFEELPKDIVWHFIGHLQTNKVKYIAPFVHLLHAVDSMKLLTTINKEAQKNSRTIQCLLQIKIADEDSKFGLSQVELEQLLSSDGYKQLEYIQVVGLMGMATNTSDDNKVRQEFNKLNGIFKFVADKYFKDQPHFKELSMGMSHDYKLAIEQGSTMVRIGSSIFGERNYQNK